MDQAATKQALRGRLDAVRARTLWLLGQVPDEDLRIRVHDFYSPIGWHFGHVGRTEEYWVMVQALGQEPIDPYLSWLLADLPDNPKDNRTKIMDRAGLVEYMAATRAVVLAALETADLTLPNRLIHGGYGWDFAIQHECQHQETITEMLTLLSKKRGPAALPDPIIWKASFERGWVTGLGGEFVMGSDDPFGYDNEKSAHRVEVAPFAMSEFPVTAFEWSEFVADGGYRRQSLWSECGWNWRNRESAELPEYWLSVDGAYFSYSPMGVRAVHPDEPAGCLSWYEAEAFARWSGNRLPTEAEWEFGASLGLNGQKTLFPWGNDLPSAKQASHRLNSFGPEPVPNFELGTSGHGLQCMAGNLWEWTSSAFLPYPGFEAFPYDGYSKDHMKGEHKVCRGGSFASSPEILRCTFRNWYVPTYRQGFLGMRLAKDA